MYIVTVTAVWQFSVLKSMTMMMKIDDDDDFNLLLLIDKRTGSSNSLSSVFF